MHVATLCMFLKLELCLAGIMNLVYIIPFNPKKVLSTRQDRNYISTCIRVIQVRKFLITFINKSLEARQVKYKMATWLQIMKTKTEVARQNKRKKKKRAVLSLFLFYYYF